MENENHFYKHKMENAQSLLLGMMKLIDEYQDILIDVEKSKESKQFNEQEETNIDNKIDEVTDEFRKAVIKHSLFLPQDIINEIEKFYDGLFDENDESKEKFEIEKFISGKLDEIENLADSLREDLGIEKLNVNLRKRIKIKK